MSPKNFLMRRRSFLQSLCGAGLVSLSRNFGMQQTGDLEKAFAEIRANLLDMVNEERAVAKVPLVGRDKLAEQVATQHAIHMVTGDFVSHWGRDGLKPYHRYSFAGGTEATAENVSSADSVGSSKVPDLKQDKAYLSLRTDARTAGSRMAESIAVIRVAEGRAAAPSQATAAPDLS